jgi:Tfp pilus assembly protein PilN
MRTLDLNLASRPYNNNTLVWLAYVGLLAAAVGFTYWNVSSFRHYRHELAELDRRQGNMAQEQSDLEDRHRKILRGVRNFDRVAIGRRASKANEVIEWRAFSWTRLFNRLESVLPSKIKMTSVRPIFRSRNSDADKADRPSMPVKVEGLARDWDALFKLQDDLFENESFGRVLPRSIDKLDNGELAFTIEFTYYPEEPITGEDSAPIDDLAQAAMAEPQAQAVDTAVEPANAAADRRKLPQASGKPTEVTDEWMARAEAIPEANAAATQSAAPASADTSRAKRNTVRQPSRRTLPKVHPDPADADDGEERR